MSSRRALVEEPVNNDPFHIKYRPATLGKVIGQDMVVDSLRDNLNSKSALPHSFLFTGPSGTGKTTLSRIVAREMGCDDVLEIDAASNSGIDAMKEVLSTLRYHGFGDRPNRAIIVDECHALSKQTWQALLKPIEEPPGHVFFFLCTTEAGKVPETIVTRCLSYNLKPVRYADLMDLLEDVVVAEKLDMDDRVLEIVARSAEGSPRQALVMLAMVQGCTDPEEASQLLAQPLEDKEIIDLCRALIDRSLVWPKLLDVLKSMPDLNAESARIVISNYMAKCIVGTKDAKAAVRLLNIAAAFSKPFASSDKLMPLLLAFGDLLFGND